MFNYKSLLQYKSSTNRIVKCVIESNLHRVGEVGCDAGSIFTLEVDGDNRRGQSLYQIVCVTTGRYRKDNRHISAMAKEIIFYYHGCFLVDMYVSHTIRKKNREYNV